jgi:hypothetical protein
MEITSKIERIVHRAIPLSDCPVKRANDEWRRENLKNDILKLLQENKPYTPVEQTKHY